MTDLTTQTPETCGTCKFGRRADITQVECRGVPPTPVITGGQPGLAGQMQFAVQLFRPILPATESACALYKFKSQIIDLSAMGEGTKQ